MNQTNKTLLQILVSLSCFYIIVKSCQLFPNPSCDMNPLICPVSPVFLLITLICVAVWCIAMYMLNQPQPHKLNLSLLENEAQHKHFCI